MISLHATILCYLTEIRAALDTDPRDQKPWCKPNLGGNPLGTVALMAMRVSPWVGEGHRSACLVKGPLPAPSLHQVQPLYRIRKRWGVQRQTQCRRKPPALEPERTEEKFYLCDSG